MMLLASKDRRPASSRDPAAARMPALAVLLHAVGAMLFAAGLLGGYLIAARLVGAADMLGQVSALIPDRPADLLAMPDARISALADMIGDGPGLRRRLEIQAWAIGLGAVAGGLILWLLCATLASALTRLERIEAALRRPR